MNNILGNMDSGIINEEFNFMDLFDHGNNADIFIPPSPEIISAGSLLEIVISDCPKEKGQDYFIVHDDVIVKKDTWINIEVSGEGYHFEAKVEYDSTMHKNQAVRACDACVKEKGSDNNAFFVVQSNNLNLPFIDEKYVSETQHNGKTNFRARFHCFNSHSKHAKYIKKMNLTLSLTNGGGHVCYTKMFKLRVCAAPKRDSGCFIGGSVDYRRNNSTKRMKTAHVIKEEEGEEQQQHHQIEEVVVFEQQQQQEEDDDDNYHDLNDTNVVNQPFIQFQMQTRKDQTLILSLIERLGGVIRQCPTVQRIGINDLSK